MTCSSLNPSPNRYRVPTVSLSAHHQRKKGLLEFTCIAMAVWMLAGCHTTTDKSSEMNSDLSETTLSSSVMTHPPISSQSPVEKYGSKKNDDEVPLWERPEILAKYPVKAKKNPDGSYDYSDPRFENADLCEDAPPGYWESRGYEILISKHLPYLTSKDCLLRKVPSSDEDLLFNFGTDARSKDRVSGTHVMVASSSKYGRFDGAGNDSQCILYLETQLGRVAAQVMNEDGSTHDHKFLCQKAKELFEELI